MISALCWDARGVLNKGLGYGMDELYLFGSSISCPWLLMKDFNVIFGWSEKREGKDSRKMAVKATISLSIYTKWKERNSRFFKEQEKSMDEVLREGTHKIKMMLAKNKNLKLTKKNVA